MAHNQRVLQKTRPKEIPKFNKEHPSQTPGQRDPASPRVGPPRRSSIESSSDLDAVHSGAAAAAPALSEALRFVLEIPPSEEVSLSLPRKDKSRDKVEALRRQYDTGKKLAKMDEVSSCKHLQADGFSEAQAIELQNALTAQVTVFSRLRSFATLIDLLNLVIANAEQPLEQVCELLRAFRCGSRSGLAWLCEELSALTAANGPLEKYACLSELADAVLEMKLGATESEKVADRSRLRLVFSKAAAVRAADSSHSGERSQRRERPENGTEKSSPTKKPKTESRVQYNGSSFGPEEKKQGVILGSRTSSQSLGQDESRVKAYASSPVQAATQAGPA